MRESDASGCTSCDDAGRALPSKAVVRRLWGRMAAIYGGGRWASHASALPETDAGEWTLAADTWARALAGLSGEQIGDGLDACMAAVDEFMPSAAQFRARCLGVPSFAAVRLMMRAPQDFAPSRFMLLVRRFVDHHAFYRASAREAEGMLRDAYEVSVEFVMRGGDLPPLPVAAIEAPKPEPRRPASRATVESALSQIDAAIGVWPRE